MSKQLDALTGLRFPAALNVVVYHTLYTFGHVRGFLRVPLVRRAIESAYLGVNMFFVLSGFVLAYAYIGADGALTVRVRDFFRTRLARVYPLHLLGLALTLPLFVLGSLSARATPHAVAVEGGRQFALCAALLQAWIPRDVFDLNGPAWSISVEAFFYLCFPFVIVAMRAVKKPWHAGLVIFIAWGAAIFAAVAQGDLRPSIVIPPEQTILHNPLSRLPDFIIGATAARLYALMPSVAASPKARRLWDVLALASLVLLALFAMTDGVPAMLVHNGLLDPLWASLIVGLARGDLVARLFAFRPWVLLGRSCFALYVLHKPLYFWMARYATRGRLAALDSRGFLITYFVAAIVLSVVVHELVEEPLRRLLSGRAYATRA